MAPSSTPRFSLRTEKLKVGNQPLRVDTLSDKGALVDICDDIPFSAITIVFDNETGVPHLDLGSIPPAAAIAIFEHIADEIRDMLPPTRITYKGEVISDVEMVDVEFEDDED
jgi:hypothetical protein